jgi:hypothetical protein
MPAAWSKKDERKYKHIKSSELKRGRGEKRAEEIAARTVNKERRSEGRTPQKSSQGKGNPNLSLEERSKDELYNQARDLDIEGRSKMSKGQLIRAIRSAR